MKTYKVVNPIIKSDIIDDVFTGNSTKEVAKEVFKLFAKYMVTTKSNRFLFTIKDINTDKQYSFDGTKTVVKQGKAVLNIKPFKINKNSDDNIITQLKGGKRHSRSRSKSRTRSKSRRSSREDKSSNNNSDNLYELSEDLLKELSLDSNDIDFSSSDSNSASNSVGGVKRKKRKKSKKSKKKDSHDNWEQWLRRRYLFPANTYFFYDPVYYYLPSYTSYVFDKNIFIPNFYYSLYPYSSSILSWGY